MSSDLWHEVYQFLSQEARLLDERRFEEWVELFTDDAFYWAPPRLNRLSKDSAEEIGILGDLAYFEEDKQSLRGRVIRLRTGKAWAEEPPSRTRHIISNIQVEPGENDSQAQVRSDFIVFRSHLETDQDFFVGTRQDILRKANGQWKIARRTIILDHAVLTAKNISIFL